MKNNSGEPKKGYLLGCLMNSYGRPTGKAEEISVVEPKSASEICRVPVDIRGRFLLRYDAICEDTSDSKTLELLVLDASGATLGKELVVMQKNIVSELHIPLKETKTSRLQRPVLSQKPKQSVSLISPETIYQIARTLKGMFPEKDKRPLVPAWVNEVIRDLNALAAVSLRVLQEDQAASRLFLQILDFNEQRLKSNAISEDVPLSTRSQTGGLTSSLLVTPQIGGRQSFPSIGFPSHRQSCILSTSGVLATTAAGFLLDRYRVEQFGNSAQPGAITTLAVNFLREQSSQLEGFRDAAIDYRAGRFGSGAFWKLTHLRDPGSPDEPLDWPPSGPITPDGIPSGPDIDPGFPPSPQLTPGLPCNFWIDCTNEIVNVATNYQPPTRCPSQDLIGSISPSAICLGATDVELEIRPIQGQQFSFTGVCNAYLQRDFNRRVLLEPISMSSDLVKVRLKEAKYSGCIGFRGAGGGTPGNVSFIDSCSRILRIVPIPILDLVRNAFDITQVSCTGKNGLDIVPPPEIDSLGGSYNSSSVVLNAEACKEVTLSWKFDFGNETQWVNPADYIRVSVIKSDGTVVGQNLSYKGAIGVTEREDETYTIRAISVVNGSECGQVQGMITVQRQKYLHLTLPSELRIGDSATLIVRSSCPALAGGLDISLVATPSASLQVPMVLAIPEGQDQATTQVTATGTNCLNVVVTATAPDHISSSTTVEIYDTPVLLGLTPTTVNACRTFNLQITGECFKAGETVVRATKAGEETRTLEILDITDSSILCRGVDFLPGSWNVSATSRGLESNAISVEVEAGSPQISFDADLAQPPLVPCENNYVIVQWDVADATRIVIRENGSIIEDRDIPVCGESSGDFTRLIQRQTEYRLEAYPIDGGSPVVAEPITVGTLGVKTYRLVNLRNGTLVAWKIEGWYPEGTEVQSVQADKVDIPPNSEVTLSFNDCVRYTLRVVDKDLAEASDRDPYGDAVDTFSLNVLNPYPIFVGDVSGFEREYPFS